MHLQNSGHASFASSRLAYRRRSPTIALTLLFTVKADLEGNCRYITGLTLAISLNKDANGSIHASRIHEEAPNVSLMPKSKIV